MVWWWQWVRMGCWHGSSSLCLQSSWCPLQGKMWKFIKQYQVILPGDWLSSLLGWSDLTSDLESKTMNAVNLKWRLILKDQLRATPGNILQICFVRTCSYSGPWFLWSLFRFSKNEFIQLDHAKQEYFKLKLSKSRIFVG